MKEQMSFPFLDIKNNNCKCGNLAKEMHTCPFRSDVNNDNEFLCNCCKECKYQSAMDI